MKESAATSAVTIRVMASTSFVLSRTRISDELSAVGCVGGNSLAVFLEFVVQGFQADGENFSRPRLVVAGGFERLQDQQPLRFFHRRAHADTNGVRLLH